ncbi:MAG: anti-sigma factor antagonist [Solirubrobacterales bacterium]|nr:anti-sigma factor antagonist [Solirubrobacterales bacterium]
MVRGEWDIANVPELLAALQDALGAADGRRVTVDLTETTFMDLTALEAIVGLHRTARGRGGGVEVLCLGDGCVHRTLTVSGIGDLLDVHVVDVHHAGHESS